jgi:DNA-binding NarL/FixJ family response regulator
VIMRVCALVGDLMDRSRIGRAIDGVEFVRDAGACREADVVLIDLARSGDAVAAVRAVAPSARVIGFGPHVDDEGARAAHAAGADEVVPRSRFFRDPSALLAE